MENVKLIVSESDDGLRADSFIAKYANNLSRSAAARLLSEGFVSSGGKTIGKSHKVSSNEVIELTLPDVQEAELVPEDISLDIIYEDDWIIVVNKPKGMVVHPSAGHESGTLVNALMYHCKNSLSGINGEKRPGIVHRIDKDTSGLLVCAKNDAAHKNLAEQIKEHTAGRVYEAVVRGSMKEERGRIEAPIGRHPTDRKHMAVTDRNARFAATNWEVAERFDRYTHLRCFLETGRTHQIRVHLAHIGRPVLGDMVYGMKKPEMGLSSQCLHASELHLTHPGTGEKMSFSAPLPEHFKEILCKLRKVKNG